MSVITAFLHVESREVVADSLLEPFVTLHDDLILSATRQHAKDTMTAQTFYSPRLTARAESLINPLEHDERRAVLYGIGAVLLWSTVATGFKLGSEGVGAARAVVARRGDVVRVLRGGQPCHRTVAGDRAVCRAATGCASARSAC